MTSPRDSAAINAKIATGRVTPDTRFPDQGSHQVSATKAAKEKLKKVDETEEPAKEAPDKAEKIIIPKATEKKKAKPKAEEKKPKELSFPVDAFVNRYNFLRVSDAVLTKLGWPTGVNVDVALDVKDGALIVRKQSK